MSAAGSRHRHHHRGGDYDRLRFGLLVQGRVATPAIVVMGAKLNQQAVITANDFPLIYRGKSRGHRVVGVPERATPYMEPIYMGERFRLQLPICGHKPVDVKVKIRK